MMMELVSDCKVNDTYTNNLTEKAKQNGDKRIYVEVINH